MRTRRQIVKVGGTALVVGIAGCMDDPEPAENGDDDDNEEPEEEPENGEDEEEEEGEEEEEAEPSFTVTSVDAPDTIEISQEFDWSVTVENEGDAAGTFETEVLRRRPGGDEEIHATVSVEVEAGETEEYTATTSQDFMGRYVYTVGETGDSFEVVSEERVIGFGESYTNPDGIELTVENASRFHNMELVGSYTYTEDGERRRDRTEEGMQFALVGFRADKSTREPKDMPEYDEFTMFVGDGEYEARERRRDDTYEGGRSRVSRSGVVMFEISESHSRSNIYDVYWTRVYPEGTVEAVWSNDA